MNYLLSWLYDHIRGAHSKLSLKKVIQIIESSIAELDSVRTIKIPFENLTLVEIVSKDKDSVLANSHELNRVIALPPRDEVVEFNCYLAYKDESEWRWATLADVGGIRDALFPCICATHEDMQGLWKEKIHPEDVCIQLDNKSIGHRPDLWGHRGLARELAAFSGLPLVPDDEFLASVELLPSSKKNKDIISVTLRTNQATFLASINLPQTQEKASSLPIALRLAQLDMRPKSFIVDATNYTLYDYGHPLHAFDQALVGNSLMACQAKEGEELSVLDGSHVTLTRDDIVIAHEEKTLSLAGIMGGSESAINFNTNHVVLEAGVFEGSSIRKTAQRLTKRTESSVRFEKHLYPYGALCALRRCLTLLQKEQIIATTPYTLAYTGEIPENKTILLEHRFVSRLLGIPHLSVEKVQKSLEQLGFSVYVLEGEYGIEYQVVVPLFRSPYDIHIPQDLVEEIARYMGLDKIEHQPLIHAAQGFSFIELHIRRSLKRLFAESFSAYETIHYGIGEKEWFDFLGHSPVLPSYIKGSHQQKFLVDSLIPHLLKRLRTECMTGSHSVSFFEQASLWKERAEEQEVLGFVSYRHKISDFYSYQESLNSFFKKMNISVSYLPIEEKKFSFLSSHSAQIYSQGKEIGYIGLLTPSISYRLLERSSSICVGELDILSLVNLSKGTKESLAPLSFVDSSLIIPFGIYAQQIIDDLQSLDTCIVSVKVIDWFDKKEWDNARSITYRIYATEGTPAERLLSLVQRYAHEKGFVIR